jgi:hypothetical protein
MNVIEWFFGYEVIEFYGMPCCVLAFCLICILCLCILGVVLSSMYAIIAYIINKSKSKKHKE